MTRTTGIILLSLALGACSAQPKATSNATPAPSQPPPPSPQAGLKEVFPHVRADAHAKVVEFDGIVPINAHNEKTPRVFLEVFACAKDTKEHESVVLTEAKPSHVHAALLLIGLEPGKPGVWDWTGEKLIATPPAGPRVTVTLLYEDNGKEIERPAADFAVSARDGRTLRESEPNQHWVFAGSQMVQRRAGEIYRADGEGCLVGLTTFGGETVAWTAMHNPDSGIEEPVWIANSRTVPAFGTKVRVRITAE